MYLSLIILLTLIGVFLSVIWSFKSLAPWVPTRHQDLKRILKLANLQPSEKFYDLGCGDGRVALYISKNSPAQVVGIELAIPFYLLSRLNQFFRRQKNILFLNKNIFSVDLREADCIYVFGMPDKLKNKLHNKLEEELKPGSRVISYCFPIDGWTPVKKDKPKKSDLAIYLYKKTA